MTAAEREVYSPAEVARAAGVSVIRVLDLVESGQIASSVGFIRHDIARELVRALSGQPSRIGQLRAPIAVACRRPRRKAVSLLASGIAHAGFVAMLVLAASLRVFGRPDTDVTMNDAAAPHLVFLVEPGPGGGGGGGGNETPHVSQPVRHRAPLIHKVDVPVPAPARPTPLRPSLIPRPVPTPLPETNSPHPNPIPPGPPAVVAPVAPAAADPVEAPATPTASTPGASARGLGTEGGEGSGIGAGHGAGIGPGARAGVGGGPEGAGSGIVPPTLEREVKPAYTDDARRRSVEGDVVLQIVVRRDGSVGAVRVLRTPGAGLEQKAIDAVRQWRFGPATRQGVPVEVVVEVSVGFTLR